MQELLKYVGSAALWGGLLLVAFWPTTRSGRALVERWGGRLPTEHEWARATRYLRVRRPLILVMFLICAPITAAVFYRPGEWWNHLDDGAGGGALLVALALSLHVGDVLDPPGYRVERGNRTMPRWVWRRLAPRRAMATFIVLTILAGLFGFASLRVNGWADRVAAEMQGADTTQSAAEGTYLAGVVSAQHELDLAPSGGWAVIVGTALVLVATLGALFLARRRLPVEAASIEATFQLRSARLGLCLGLSTMVYLTGMAGEHLEMLHRVDRQLGAHDLPAPAWLESTVSMVAVVECFALAAALIAWHRLVPYRPKFRRDRPFDQASPQTARCG